VTRLAHMFVALALVAHLLDDQYIPQASVVSSRSGDSAN